MRVLASEAQFEVQSLSIMSLELEHTSAIYLATLPESNNSDIPEPALLSYTGGAVIPQDVLATDVPATRAKSKEKQRLSGSDTVFSLRRNRFSSKCPNPLSPRPTAKNKTKGRSLFARWGINSLDEN